MSQFSRWQHLVLPIGLIAGVMVILVPLPPMAMDVLLAANITLAVIVLLTTIQIKSPLEFSIFPTLLLTATLGRLVLNVATTRLILTRAGSHDTGAAGGVIKSFGEFVAGDQIVVGLVIFAILIVIQYVVITKGATRISEVSARFALDGLPGRQMAIDADLNAGNIDKNEASRRREELTEQADFYGAMDGASKFVRGDAIAGVIITLINIVGGLAIGVLDGGMNVGEAATVYTKLTIGDGLVSQLPAFLVALAAGLLVTRSTNKMDLPVEFLKQIFSRPQALAVAGGFLVILVFTKLPAIPLLTIGGGCTGLAIMLTRQQRETEAEQAAAKEPAEPATPSQDRIEDFLTVDPMEIELGVGLIRLAGPSHGGDLLARVTAVRRRVAGDIGIILPKVRIRDNMRLGRRQYRIKIANNPVAEGSLYPGKLLAVATASHAPRLNGIETTDPVSGRTAWWIDNSQADRAESLGFRISNPSTVLSDHLLLVVEHNADEILSRDACQHLIDELRKSSPAAVNELIPDVMRLADVQKILQLLLQEGVPIRQLGLILETIGDAATRTKDPRQVVEHVRRRLARTLCNRYRDQQGTLQAVALDTNVEEQIATVVANGNGSMNTGTWSALVEQLCNRIAVEVKTLGDAGMRPVVIASPETRAAVKKLTASRLPQLVVLSYAEITRDTHVNSHATVSVSNTN